ncbi:MAG: hypothetical protein RIC56_10055 [Pseudomonadales bacterium]
MDIMDLLKGDGDLLESIKGLGVPEDKIPDLGQAIGQQLGGGDGFDLTDLLGGLDLQSFLAKVDVGAIASQLNLSPDVIQQVVALIGPKVQDFVPGGLGSLGSLAGKLFR